MADQRGLEFTHMCLEYLEHGISVIDAEFNLVYVNLKFIEKYDKSGAIHLKNGIRIPVSSRKKENFLTYLFNWNKK